MRGRAETGSESFVQNRVANEDSNYGFGEGGAGTFSDGKLFTRSKKRGNVDRILEILVYHGANSNILIDAHPHIGTDKLPQVIVNMQQNHREVWWRSTF